MKNQNLTDVPLEGRTVWSSSFRSGRPALPFISNVISQERLDEISLSLAETSNWTQGFR